MFYFFDKRIDPYILTQICDWGSLDENLIQIRVATLKRLLPIVVSYGLEQKDSVIEQLMVIKIFNFTIRKLEYSI